MLLKERNLCETTATNGHCRLTPINAKQKVWHKNEYMTLVNRLYQLEKPSDITSVNKLDESTDSSFSKMLKININVRDKSTTDTEASYRRNKTPNFTMKQLRKSRSPNCDAYKNSAFFKRWKYSSNIKSEKTEKKQGTYTEKSF